MATFPHDQQKPKDDHPLITVGVVMAVLLITLLVLPFIARARDAAHHHAITPVPAGSAAQAVAR